MTVEAYNAEALPDSPLRRRAAEIAEKLVQTTRSMGLIHGDLHHFNILEGPDGWVAIDPKGLLGDPAFEVTGYMRNPIRHIDKDTLRLRLRMFHELLGDPVDRLWGWSFAQTAVCGLGSESDFSRACLHTAANLWDIRHEFGCG
jgi:streptomycin 6-kinase